MSRVSIRFSVRQTALGSIVLALAGCGGKGERLAPNASEVEDAGVIANSCNLTATLDIANFGCTPGPSAHCADFEGYPAGSRAIPTGWFSYIDKIVSDPHRVADASILPEAEFIDPNTGLVSATANTYATMKPEDKHCNSGAAAYHLLAENQAVWGPQFGVKFDGPVINASDLPAVDVSGWDGMGFWIKKGNDHPELEPTGTTTFVGLSDPHTMPGSIEINCNDASNIDSEKCDAFGAGVSFDTNWRFVMLRFDDLRQRGYGVHEDKLDRTKIMQLKFAMDIGDGANGNWNVWIDDVMLYKYK